jgi:DNA-directed RNA polymerase specialized sigma24 family protein
MSSEGTVTHWVRQLEAGDHDAARQLWQRYYQELVELARARLGSTPRRMSDEEDVALSVMRCLYDGAARGQFAALVNRQELWQLLAAITVRKVIDHQRHLTKQKRGGGRVRGNSVLQAGDGDRGHAGFDDIFGDDATPEVEAIAAEEFQRLMVVLDDDRLRQIAQFKLDGFTNEEIGGRLGLACRSIERKLQRIRQVWAGELGEVNDPPTAR